MSAELMVTERNGKVNECELTAVVQYPSAAVDHIYSCYYLGPNTPSNSKSILQPPDSIYSVVYALNPSIPFSFSGPNTYSTLPTTIFLVSSLGLPE